ncbi:MAG: GNAT family N-acetyltransferase [Nocardioides sp.]
MALERQNFVACYTALADAAPGGATLQQDGCFAFVTGLPLPMFNGCIVTRPDDPAGVDAAAAWLAQHDLPFSLWAPGGTQLDVDALAAEHGLAREEHPLPGMVLHPVPASPAPPSDLGVERLRAGREADFAQVVQAVGLGDDMAALLTSPAFAQRDDVDLFVGYLDEAPVGTSIAISSAGAGGVVNVLTVEEARGRGIGTALTWAAVQAGAARGHNTVVLQATQMGLPVYRTMGFTTVVEYAEYA